MDGIIYSKNLSLSQIYHSGQCFRWKHYRDGYQIPIRNRSFYIEGDRKDETAFHVCGDVTLDEVWRYFDLYTDYSAIIRKIPSADEFMSVAAATFSGIRILQQDLDEVAVSFLISQNNSIKRIQRSVDLLASMNGGAFPTVDEVAGTYTDDMLQAASVGYRARYMKQMDGKKIRDLAGADRDCQKALCEMPGVGPKVASCIQLYGMHKLYSCPIDRWMKRIIEEHYQSTEPWWVNSPYAGVYQQYAFAYERCVSGAF